jgi:multiple sugar transport system permease protein
MRRRRRIPFQRIAAYATIAVALVLTLFPVYWIASNSLKFDIDIFSVPPQWYPESPSSKHWCIVGAQILQWISPDLLHKACGDVATAAQRPFGMYALNSLIIAVSTTIVSLVLGTLAGYALARFSYPGQWRYQISFWILSTRMMPPIVTIIPLYLAFNYFNMLNTKPAVVIAYTAFNLPFATWMMKSYFQDLPVELEEAAIVDGDTRWGAFLRVALPLARPGLAATAIFSLIISWNEFLLALVLTLSERSQTLPIGIAGRVTQYNTYWGEISAAGFAACVPIMIFAFIVQKHLVRGLSFGAVKG